VALNQFADLVILKFVNSLNPLINPQIR